MSLLSQIQSQINQEPVPRDFHYKGVDYKFLVKIIPASEVETIGERGLNKGKKNKAEQVNFRSRMIAAAVVGDDGKGIPFNLCRAMPNGLSLRFWKAVAEVNDLDVDDDEDEDGVTAEEKSSPETPEAD